MSIGGFVERALKAGIGSELSEEVHFAGSEHPLSALEEEFFGNGADVHVVGDILKVVSGGKSMEIRVDEKSPSSIIVGATIFDATMAFAH